MVRVQILLSPRENPLEDTWFNPIQSVLWNYVKECGGAIMARIDLGILKL